MASAPKKQRIRAKNLGAKSATLSLVVANNVHRRLMKDDSKVKGGIGDFVVDSTDSVDNLLAYFSNKYPFARRVYTKIMSTRILSNERNWIKSHFSLPGHPVNTFPEGWDGVLPSGYIEKFTYKISKPAIMTRMQNIGFKDPSSMLLSEKHDWHIRIQNALMGARHTELSNLVEKLSDGVVLCPEHIVKIAAKLDMDPDSNMTSPFNWYYSGNGNMQVLTVNNIECVMHSEFSRLYLSKLSRRKLKIKNKNLCMYNCGKDRHILETICNSNNFVALRLKNAFVILKIVLENEEILFRKVKEIQSDMTCTSVTFDPHSKNVLYVTKLDSSVSMVNLNTMKVKNLKLSEPESLVNNWGTVVGFDENTYSHIDSKTIRIYDKRNNSVVQTWTDTPGPKARCNFFSVCKKCENIPFMYVGTTHHLFLMDLRFNGDNKVGMLQRWTHQMQSPPIYLSIGKFEQNRDLVCLSSQIVDDTCIVTNDSQAFHRGSYCRSMSLPLRLPTFEKVINEAQKKMMCLDLYNPIETRVYTCVTGNALVEYDDKHLILTQNALGDIFAYTLYPDHLDLDDEDYLQRFDRWSQSNKKHEVNYEFTDVFDISNILNDLKRVPREHKFGGYKIVPDEVDKFSVEDILKTVESGELDDALLEIWGLRQDKVEPTQADLTIDLHFSDEDSN